ncbi:MULTISPECIES: nickel-type superoxide dismutase maturation protease [unclassified Moorena]|uniref:nickel-type superoxide dismutase maturation protease n=1 Tax=unclassified Moorena TaxID=2683338 RepID=UPI0013BCFB93|nr:MULTISPECIES: nickel-type superoxide dismutase maturation protease [unclassified Moorena]NEQ13575.1 nickel-type superoxide dismutase maturation protease [Moorena sp. SIO3E2]NES87207.1 nickel-type superoxide dismutase maturation protease [Moorena sp. SIO2B7]NEP35567.1 nickel-type superoxide dismutase maturation protease [Moorena sp. SIO3B2]NEQ08154.1 nickel-type superoxide dismutase maturation protease [Moorena sp. SIO4E2]NER86039.1 nickel-type superoxide dismutase maturation protease [Moore
MLSIKNSIPELLLWILRKRLRFRVTGVSMTPLFKPGEEILIDPRAYQHIPPKIGDIVVARHPYQNHLRLVKRVTLVLEDGRCFLKGDNRLESTDSRSFGLVDSQQIIGKVTSRFF